MSLISQMRAAKKGNDIPGTCAKCAGAVYESLSLLDDAYNVWVGICPHCKAANLLGLTSLRGYSSQGMQLVLPTDEEIAANDWPREWPTRGSKGPATAHGTVAGEFMYQLALRGLQPSRSDDALPVVHARQAGRPVREDCAGHGGAGAATEGGALMEVHKIEICVVDFDKLGGMEVRDAIETARYPNRCVSPQVLSVRTRDIGEWSDDHPLNRESTAPAEMARLFPDPAEALAEALRNLVDAVKVYGESKFLGDDEDGEHATHVESCIDAADAALAAYEAAK